MTCGIARNKATAVRRCRILLTCAVCAALVPGSGFQSTALRAQTLQQQQQQRERQQELEREREEQQRQREQEQERQREQQREREQEQERQREQQQEREQEQQRQREQQQQREREQEQQRQQQEQQRQQQQQREQERQQEQQREQQQQRERELEQQQRQREQQQRMQTQRPAPQQSVPEPRDPVLQTRPVNPEPIRPVRMPEAPAVNTPRPVESRPMAPRPVVPERQVNGIEPRPLPHLPERRPEPVRGELPIRPELPHPILPRPVIAPEHHPDPVHLDPPRHDGRPVIVERPVVVEHKDVIVERPRVVVARPSTEVILALPAPRRTVVIGPQPGVMYVAPTPAQNYAAAQARLQAAQASCAQADAYQNYVNSVISNQNNMSQGMDQVLQTIADNTTDPNTQSAILGAIGQPNPINDALQQQLTAQAGTYESMCQSRLAAAQAAMPPDPSQTGVAVTAGGQVMAGDSAAQAGAVQQAPQAVGATADPGDPGAPAQPASQACTSGVTRALPTVQGQWGPWVPLGNTGLVFGELHVNAKNLTWRFMNAGSQTITSLDFTYTYVDADTGQTTTSPDQLPYALKPGQSVGGWAAYLANTRGDISIQITDIACR